MDKNVNHAINNLPWKFEWLESAMKYWISDSKGVLVCATKDIFEANRIVLCVNACDGITAEELENGSGFFRLACSRLDKKAAALDAENAALRAAVWEMERMLPVLEYVQGGTSKWEEAIAGTGVLSLNAYRQSLETALAKMKESK